MNPNKKSKRPKIDKAFLEKLMNDLLRPLGICLCYGPVKSDFQDIWCGLYSSSDSWFFKALESGGVCKCSYEAIWIYVVHILRRPKDISLEMKNALGANESQRLIKTYYIDSLEYFDRKREAIKELCRANHARAYIIVQPKDNFECLLNLGEKIFETIRNKNYSVKPEHLIRQAFCEWHKTRKKQWILDLDDTEMFGWTREQVKALVIKKLEEIGKNSNDIYEVQTKHGIHIITSPFNLAEANKECPMLYEGVKKGHAFEDVLPFLHMDHSKNEVLNLINEHRLSPFDLGNYVVNSYYVVMDDVKHKIESKRKDITGWLHKDGMTLLWMTDNYD